MTVPFIAAFVCYALVAFFLIIFGAIYLTRPTLMPYHLDAIGRSWADLDASMQTLFLALMRVAGTGFLVTALSMLMLLLIPFRAGEIWASYAIPAVGLVQLLFTLYVTMYVRKYTPGSPPVGMNILGVGLLILGFIMSLF